MAGLYFYGIAGIKNNMHLPLTIFESFLTHSINPQTLHKLLFSSCGNMQSCLENLITVYVKSGANRVVP